MWHKHHDVDPFAYFGDILRRLPAHPEGRLDELLPDVWFVAHPRARRKTVAHPLNCEYFWDHHAG